ncbi:MAG: Riboflavin biosynthesis protein [Bacteroidota bacterium]|nr:Riboflavin biosynthesis protein [Bacteroidota bacterium]
MNIFHSFEEIEFNSETVLTVGTFDGVHLGHQTIIGRMLSIAAKEHLRHLLITIDPHPQIVLQINGRAPIKLLTNIKERLTLFEMFGIENTLVVPFNIEFSQIAPEIFVRDYLAKKIGLKKILIGYDHMFGRDRQGNSGLLEQLSRELSFGVEKISPFQEKNITISSTKIRHALLENNINQANEMLGYNYFVSGKVVYGSGRGSKLGYPTANIKIKDNNKLLPANGVYFVSAEIEGRDIYGMANLGTRPTFTKDNFPTLEVYFFDFNGDIYNKHIQLSFLKFIRIEKKFTGEKDFLAQLKKDNEFCYNLKKTFYN